MRWHNTSLRYGSIAQALHWLIAIGIIAQYILAESAEGEAASAGPFSAAGVHVALGMAILIMASVRLAWRVIEPPPARPAGSKTYEVVLARAAHAVFYVLLFTIPLTGWALATAGGEGVSIFGWFDLPQFRPLTQVPLPWFEGGSLSKHQLEELHEVLFQMLVGLSVLHIAAALKHHFIDRDNVLRSMLPGR